VRDISSAAGECPGECGEEIVFVDSSSDMESSASSTRKGSGSTIVGGGLRAVGVCSSEAMDGDGRREGEFGISRFSSLVFSDVDSCCN